MDAQTFLDTRITRLAEAARRTGCELPKNTLYVAGLDSTLTAGDPAATRRAASEASEQDALKSLERTLKNTPDALGTVEAVLEGRGTTARELLSRIDPNVHPHVARALGKLLKAERPTRADFFTDLFGHVRSLDLLDLLSVSVADDGSESPFQGSPFLETSQVHALVGTLSNNVELGERGEPFVDAGTAKALLENNRRASAALAWRAGVLDDDASWTALAAAFAPTEVLSLVARYAGGGTGFERLPDGLRDAIVSMDEVDVLGRALTDYFIDGYDRDLTTVLLNEVPLSFDALETVLLDHPDLAAAWINRAYPLQRRDVQGSHQEVQAWALNTYASAVRLQDVEDVEVRRILVETLDGVGKRFVEALDNDEADEVAAYLPAVLDILDHSGRALSNLVLAGTNSPMTQSILTLNQGMIILEKRRQEAAARKAKQG